MRYRAILSAMKMNNMKRYKSNVSALINIERITEIGFENNNDNKVRYYALFELFEETENKIYITDIDEAYISASDGILMNYNLKQLFLSETSIECIINCLSLDDDNKVKLVRAFSNYILDRSAAYSSKDSIKLNDFDKHNLNEILCNNEKFEPRINRIIIMIPKFIEKVYPLLREFIK